jgi:hypothetical protein
MRMPEPFSMRISLLKNPQQAFFIAKIFNKSPR